MTGGLVPIPSVMDIHDCREMFSQYYVDPNIAQQNVPTKWNASARPSWTRSACKIWLWLVRSQKDEPIRLPYTLSV